PHGSFAMFPTSRLHLSRPKTLRQSQERNWSTLANSFQSRLFQHLKLVTNTSSNHSTKLLRPQSQVRLTLCAKMFSVPQNALPIQQKQRTCLLSKRHSYSSSATLRLLER